MFVTGPTVINVLPHRQRQNVQISVRIVARYNAAIPAKNQVGLGARKRRHTNTEEPEAGRKKSHAAHTGMFSVAASV